MSFGNEGRAIGKPFVDDNDMSAKKLNYTMDGSQFQVDFKTREISVQGQIHLTVFGNKRTRIDRLNNDLVDMMVNHIRDNMQKYVEDDS